MNKNEFGLQDFCQDFGYFHIKIDRQFLKELLIKASNNQKPHCDMKLIDILGLKPSTKYLCNTIYGWTSSNKTIPLNKLAKIVELIKVNWREVEDKIISLKAGQHGGEICLRFPIKIDKRLGSIIGHILGDGSVDARFQQISFSNSNKELLKEFATNMKHIFGIEPRIWMQKIPDFGNTAWDKKLNDIEELVEGRNCSLFYPTACSLILNKIFNNFAIGKNKKITKEIVEQNREFKIGLIRAFYDDEGSVNKSGNSIRLFQDRKEMLEVFRNLLNDFGITSGNIKTYKKGNKERYYFDIFRKTNFITFQKEIGFTSQNKAKILNQMTIIKNYKNSK